MTEPREDADWQERLAEMDKWYWDLLGTGYEAAEKELLYWFEPHAEYLGRLRGSLIDIGGGVGLHGRFLERDCKYTVVDPHSLWDHPEWRSFARRFTGDCSVRFVEGRGEALPFADDSFDCGMAFSSLNHVERADACIAELARVVQMGGKVLIVLEEMEPSWADLARSLARRLALRCGLVAARSLEWQIPGFRKTVRQKLSARPWTVGPDHYLISEKELRAWLEPRFRIVSRSWRGQLLTFELVKVA